MSFEPKETTLGTIATSSVRCLGPWPLVRGNFDALILPYLEASCIAAVFLCRMLQNHYFLFAPNTNDQRKTSVSGMVSARCSRMQTGTGGPAQHDWRTTVPS